MRVCELFQAVMPVLLKNKRRVDYFKWRRYSDSTAEPEELVRIIMEDLMYDKDAIEEAVEIIKQGGF
jgi:hypothetical protein